MAKTHRIATYFLFPSPIIAKLSPQEKLVGCTFPSRFPLPLLLKHGAMPLASAQGPSTLNRFPPVHMLMHVLKSTSGNTLQDIPTTLLKLTCHKRKQNIAVHFFRKTRAHSSSKENL